MSKTIILFFVVIFAIAVVELKPLSEESVGCNTKPEGCPKEINPRPKRHLHCLFFPHLCMPQYVPVYYPANTVNTYNIVNGNGNHNSVVLSQG